ncbi:transketolase [Listeria aquatica]|uniref:Transketolase n=1 Tax=Listeria aquatica TaxID=1494960 RepID=A0A841ZS79_9LIST|nr:transketolase [Listeria aquatica]MBC1522128.1 transketolase [Listeria aquatica]
MISTNLKPTQDLNKFAARIRKDVLAMLLKRGYGHVGGSLSIVELLAVLYGKQMNYRSDEPHWEKRDYLVLSKGHSGPGVYSALANSGFFPKSWVETLNEGGTNLPSHLDRNKTPGVDATTGSLGQGTSIATGIAAGLVRKGANDQYVYLITGDGELNEGQCWEAFQYIAHAPLSNCIVFIDENKGQNDGKSESIIRHFDLAEKMRAFGFYTQKVDGQNIEMIDAAIEIAKNQKTQANCIVLDTIKGQGVPFFENYAGVHSVKFNSQEIIEATESAIRELEEQVKD